MSRPLRLLDGVEEAPPKAPTAQHLEKSRAASGRDSTARGASSPRQGKKELCEFYATIDSYLAANKVFFLSGDGLRFLTGVRPLGTGCGERGPSILTDNK